jgi:hypothetical protein
MSPQEHYDEAERLLRAPYADADTHRAAQVHATLALAGFTRDYAPGRLA